MTTLHERMQRLSGDKRALLEKALGEKQLHVALSGPVTARRDAGPAPLSFAQERLWILEQMDRASCVYIRPLGIRFTGQLKMQALAGSLNEIISRHEVLRTGFELLDGAPIQIIHPAWQLDLPLVDLTSMPDSRCQEEMQRIVGKLLLRGFDLAKDRLFRASLLRVKEHEHLLLLAFHHIIFDGWSSGVFLRELMHHYEAYSLGRPLLLPELTVQYADFSEWQRGHFSGQVLEKELEYWQSRLKHVPHVLNLPADRPRLRLRSNRGARHPVSVSARATARLKEIGRQEGASLFMTLLAVFAVLLHRYSGQEQFIIGVPVANRTRKEIEGLIGFFVNTLALGMDLSGDPAFIELLRRVRDTAVGAYANQQAPFERVVERLNPDRDPGLTPLFQVVFVIREALPAWQQGGLKLEPVELYNSTSKFDLTLDLEDYGGALKGWIEYNTDLFDKETITRLAGHFLNIVEQVSADPAQRTGEIQLLSAAERKQLLIDWNATGTPLAHDACVHQLFEAQAALLPGAVAVVFEKVVLTYADLNARANQLAHALTARGVSRDVPVAILLERSPEMIVALLAVLKAGGAYVPLDPDYPAERLSFIIEDSGAGILLTREALRNRLPLSAEQILCLDSANESISAHRNNNPDCSVAGEHLAYIIYTSGSTGKPKGVAVTHRGLSNLIQAPALSFDLAPDSRVLQFASFSFDASVLEIMMALCAGSALYLPDAGQRLPGLPLLHYIDENDITHMILSPSVLAALPQAELPRLTSLIAGGEPCPPGLAAFWSQGRRFYNAYGPTEATVCSVIAEYAGADIDCAAPLPIGRPITNTKLYVLDSRNQPTPIGVPGELHIGGAGLARGYLNRPELTAEKFIPDPFSSVPGARIYKTGDLVRYRPDGNLEYLGRCDHQVKIRGFRIEPGEVEAALGQHPDLLETVVVVREDMPGSKRLVAYTVPKTGSQATPGELRRFLSAKLPEHMIPSAFVVLASLPLTTNGKVDRRALPAPDHVRPELEEVFTVPRTPIEQAVAGIWEVLLGLEQVGVKDNFFHLGGDSLLATQVISQVCSLFKVDVALLCLFESPTIAALAENIETALRRGQRSDTPAITPALRPEKVPLSFAQQRLWFLDQWDPCSATYNVSICFDLTGQCNATVFNESLNEIIRRHEALRTTFIEIDGEPVQRIAATLELKIALVALSEVETDDELRFLIAEEARKPFDLAQGPLVRATLFRSNPEKHVLMVTMHHIVTDGWSMGVFCRELGILYGAFIQDRPSPLPDLPVQYADFAEWQRNRLKGEVLENQLSYWRNKLAGINTLELPTNRPRPAVQTNRGATQGFLISRSLGKALRLLSRQSNVTIFMTLLAAFQTLLYRYTGQDDIAVGSQIANRSRVELETLIGFFANTLVMRTSLAGSPTFRELLSRVRETALEAYAHQDLPFEKLVKELNPARDSGGIPFIRVMLVLQNVPARSPDFPGLDVKLDTVDNGNSKLDLVLILTEAHEGIQGKLEYNTDLFDRETIERMTGHFLTLLEAVAAAPDELLSGLPLLTEVERHRMLVEWNDTGSDYPKNKCIHELFEQQVERVPEAVALVFEDRRLSYRELNSQANQLAHQLIKLGVGPDVPVGVCLDRSLEMIVGILAILKAGGAYLPFDPGLPQDRIAFMLEDAGISIILTQKRFSGLSVLRDRQIVCLDDFRASSGEYPESNPANRTGPENLAYVMYTSGSTGQPKGVEIPHRGVVRLLTGVDYAVFDDRQTFLQLAPASFDASTFELWGALLHGSRCVLYPGQIATPHQLGDIIRSEGVTTLWLTSSFFNVVMDTCPEALSGVSQLLTGGEALSPLHVQKALKALPGTRIINGYGPTENTTFTCCYPIPDQPVRAGIPIGRPISNTKVYILDKHLQPVPIGVKGELCIGGDGLARGYLDQPELTREKFIPDPFSTDPGALLYKSGDITSYLPSGDIEFHGRSDGQVKIRGFRIEPGEIESLLSRHPNVRHSVVTVSDDIQSGKRLVAYIVPAERREQLLPELRHYLQEKLPSYMVPAAMVLIDTLPLTANGKLDLRALPPPDFGLNSRNMRAPQVRAGKEQLSTVELESLIGSHPAIQECSVVVRDLGNGETGPAIFIVLKHQQTVSGSELVSFIAKKSGGKFVTDIFFVMKQLPRTPENMIDLEKLAVLPLTIDKKHHPRDTLEVMLASIWEELLGVGNIDRVDNFFDLGGDSLQAVQMAAKVETELGIRLPLASIFENATVEALARALRDMPDCRYDSPLILVQAGVLSRPLFFFHGDLLGGGFHCRKLARYMGGDQTFYAVQPYGLPGQPAPASIEAMAKEYLAHIVAVEPEGPYRLAGHCNGALVVFEVAQRLLKNGKSIELLIMVEPPPPEIARPADDLSHSVQPVSQEIDLDTMDFEARRVVLMESYVKICGDYVPDYYPGRLTIFVAGSDARESCDKTAGWLSLAEKTEVHLIPGGHESIFTLNLEPLAAHMRACLSALVRPA